MSFWSKLFGRRSSAAREPIRFPATFELEPGRMAVKVYSHEIEAVDGRFWSVVSEGLEPLGQREIVVTLKRRERETEEELPAGLLELFRTLYGLAKQKRIVDEGGFTRFGKGGFLEPHLGGMVYASAELIDGVELPRRALVGVALHAREMDVVKMGGAFRILGRLGLAHRRFPFPCWSDRDRASVAHDGEATSLLARIGGRRVRHVSVIAVDEVVTLRLLPGAELAPFLDQVPDDHAVTLFLEPDPTASACLVWTPGQAAPQAISAADTADRYTGNHVMIAGGCPDDQIDQGEDGYWLRLTESSFRRFKDAVREGRAFELRGPEEGRRFRLAWIWRMEIRYLGSEEETAAAIDTGPLGLYVGAIERAITETIPAIPRRTIEVHVELAPETAPRARVTSGPVDVPAETQLRIAVLPAPTVRAPLTFRVDLELGSDA